jgi:hypothetical protein
LEGFFYNCIVKWNLKVKEECEREMKGGGGGNGGKIRNVGRGKICGE